MPSWERYVYAKLAEVHGCQAGRVATRQKPVKDIPFILQFRANVQNAAVVVILLQALLYSRDVMPQCCVLLSRAERGGCDDGGSSAAALHSARHPLPTLRQERQTQGQWEEAPVCYEPAVMMYILYLFYCWFA